MNVHVGLALRVVNFEAWQSVHVIGRRREAKQRLGEYGLVDAILVDQLGHAVFTVRAPVFHIVRYDYFLARARERRLVEALVNARAALFGALGQYF